MDCLSSIRNSDSSDERPPTPTDSLLEIVAYNPQDDNSDDDNDETNGLSLSDSDVVKLSFDETSAKQIPATDLRQSTSEPCSGLDDESIERLVDQHRHVECPSPNPHPETEPVGRYTLETDSAGAQCLSCDFREETFDVFFSPLAAEATAQSNEARTSTCDGGGYGPKLSADSFKAYERESLKQFRELIRIQWIEEAADVLKQNGFDETECVELAEAIVINGEQIKLNAIPDNPWLGQLYEVYDRWLSIESYQCLLVSAPHGDLKDRRQEMESFCRRAFPQDYFDDARLDRTIAFCEVNTADELYARVRDFFERASGIRAKTALHAVVVFFGHGSPEGGLCLSRAKSDVSLDAFNKFVKDRWREATLRKPEELPAKVEIVYSQCHGHRYDPSIVSERFNVVSFTTDLRPFTHCRKHRDSGKWYNVELLKFADEHFLPVSRNAEERRGHVRNGADGDGFVDLSAAGKDTTAASGEAVSSPVEDATSGIG